MRKEILGLPIDIINIAETLDLAKQALLQNKQLKIITLNPEMIVNAYINSYFRETLDHADLIVPDGAGITWSLKLLYPDSLKKIKRVPGIDLAERILQAASELQKRVAIFGGTKEVIEKAIETLKKNYTNIKIVKAINGYEGENKDKEIAEEISQSSPNVLLVALGTPRQEIWINKFSSFFPHAVMIGIGGSLDVWSLKKKRAPRWIRRLHFEWLYRALTEPKRMIRVLKTLPVFMWMVLKKKLELHPKQNRFPE